LRKPKKNSKEDKLQFIKKYLRDFADKYDCFYSCLIIIPDKYDADREVAFFAIRGPEEHLVETMLYAMSNMKEKMAKPRDKTKSVNSSTSKKKEL